jgi:hypothetical protein
LPGKLYKVLYPEGTSAGEPAAGSASVAGAGAGYDPVSLACSRSVEEQESESDTEQVLDSREDQPVKNPEQWGAPAAGPSRSCEQDSIVDVEERVIEGEAMARAGAGSASGQESEIVQKFGFLGEIQGEMQTCITDILNALKQDKKDIAVRRFEELADLEKRYLENNGKNQKLLGLLTELRIVFRDPKKKESVKKERMLKKAQEILRYFMSCTLANR